MVARWYIFHNQNSYFGGPCNGKCWYVLYPFGIFSLLGIFYVHSVFFWTFGIHIFPILENCTNKNLATLIHNQGFPVMVVSVDDFGHSDISVLFLQKNI
jgi:hypothetical protein